jgi:hypothetical protein
VLFSRPHHSIGDLKNSRQSISRGSLTASIYCHAFASMAAAPGAMSGKACRPDGRSAGASEALGAKKHFILPGG